MTAEQRQMFQDTLWEDEADLEAQLAALPQTLAAPKAPPGYPRRQALFDVDANGVAGTEGEGDPVAAVGQVEMRAGASLGS